MSCTVPRAELHQRLEALRHHLCITAPNWRMVAIFTKVNQYYFTGTMQDGVVLIPRDGAAVYWVRRSLERALDEAEFADIRPMNSFRDAAAAMQPLPDTIHLEMEHLPLALYQRFNKHFGFREYHSADAAISAVRAVKSAWELERMERSGAIHQRILEQELPKLLRRGMSEADLASELYPLLVKAGHHGLARFSMFDTEVLIGHIAFGTSSIYPTSFDGPGGNYGLSAAVPLLGSRERTLRDGDLVFVDIGCGVDGYHTDKTMTYVFRGHLPSHAVDSHRRCVAIQDRVAHMLRPEAIPEQIYQQVMAEQSDDFLANFMGYRQRRARFLAHGIGLHIDEWPVVAPGFSTPLQQHMVMAIEPKRGIDGIGLVGTENTFVIEADGSRCITGNHPGLLAVE